MTALLVLASCDRTTRSKMMVDWIFTGPKPSSTSVLYKWYGFVWNNASWYTHF